MIEGGLLQRLLPARDARNQPRNRGRGHVAIDEQSQKRVVSTRKGC
jgi:hypothetical protein